MVQEKKGVKFYFLVLVLLVFGFTATYVFAQANQVVDLSAGDSDYFMEVTRGNIQGQSHINKFGACASVGTTAEFIWDGCNTYYFLSSGTVLNFSSSNTGDAYGGIGAWQLEIQGLDENWSEQTEVVNLTGQTLGTTTKQWLRVFRMRILYSGNGNNLGDVYVYTGASGSGVPSNLSETRAKISQGNGQTLMSIYTIPVGKTGYLLKGYATSAGSKNVNIQYFNRPFNQSKQIKFDFDMLNAPFIYEFGVPSGPISEKTDLWVEASIDAGTTKVSTGFDLILIEE